MTRQKNERLTHDLWLGHNMDAWHEAWLKVKATKRGVD